MRNLIEFNKSKLTNREETRGRHKINMSLSEYLFMHQIFKDGIKSFFMCKHIYLWRKMSNIYPTQIKKIDGSSVRVVLEVKRMYHTLLHFWVCWQKPKTDLRMNQISSLPRISTVCNWSTNTNINYLAGKTNCVFSPSLLNFSVPFNWPDHQNLVKLIIRLNYLWFRLIITNLLLQAEE